MTDELDELNEIFSPELKRAKGEEYTTVGSDKVKPFKEQSVSDILTAGTGELLPDVMPKPRRTATKKPVIPPPTESKTIPSPYIMRNGVSRWLGSDGKPSATAADSPEPYSMGPATIHDGANRWPATVIKMTSGNSCIIVEDTVIKDSTNPDNHTFISAAEGNRKWRVSRNTDKRWRIVGGPRHVVTFAGRQYSTTVF